MWGNTLGIFVSGSNHGLWRDENSSLFVEDLKYPSMQRGLLSPALVSNTGVWRNACERLATHTTRLNLRGRGRKIATKLWGGVGADRNGRVTHICTMDVPKQKKRLGRHSLFTLKKQYLSLFRLHWISLTGYPASRGWKTEPSDEWMLHVGRAETWFFTWVHSCTHVFRVPPIC